VLDDAEHLGESLCLTAAAGNIVAGHAIAPARTKPTRARLLSARRQALAAERRSTAILTVHHLNQSRSHRILWLLEELQLAYAIEHYQRDSHTNLAPPELKRVHPLGKSPVITDSDGTVVAESGAIIDYIVRRHGGGRMQPPPSSPLYDQYVQWLHYAEGSAALPLIMKATVKRLDSALGHGRTFAPLARHVDEELASHLGYIDTTLQGRKYLLGDLCCAADIQLSFVGEQAAKAVEMSRYPSLAAWLQRLESRQAYQAALRRGDPEFA
jgi:glutathione S-transferase